MTNEIEPTWLGRTIAKLILWTPLGDFDGVCDAHLWAYRRWPWLFRRAAR